MHTQQQTLNNKPLMPETTLQGYLTKLDLGNLVSTGMLSVNVLFSNNIQVRPKFSRPDSRPSAS